MYTLWQGIPTPVPAFQPRFELVQARTQTSNLEFRGGKQAICPSSEVCTVYAQCA